MKGTIAEKEENKQTLGPGYVITEVLNITFTEPSHTA